MTVKLLTHVITGFVDKNWMKTSSNVDKKGKILGLKKLYRLLRDGKKNLSAIWEAGDWLDERFKKKHAERGDVAVVAEKLRTLKRIIGPAPVSVNHLHKCRQFRLLWTKAEINLIKKVGLSWRRALQLTVIRSHAERLKEKNPGRRAQIRRDCKRLIALFRDPSHLKTSRSSPNEKKCRGSRTPWAKEVEKLKRGCQVNNPGLSKIKKRLMVSCWEAAVSKLEGIVTQIEKMRGLIPKKQLKYARAALRHVNAALKPLTRIYKRKARAR